MKRANVGRISNPSQPNVGRISNPSQPNVGRISNPSHLNAPQNAKSSGAILPQENFWLCYCSGMELYIAVAVAILVHVGALGFLSFFAVMLTVQEASLAPPITDVIEIEGGGGMGGLFALAPGSGAPITASKGAREKSISGKEAIDPKKEIKQKTASTKNLLDPIEPAPIDITAPDKTKIDDGKSKIFAEIRKKAKKQLAMARRQVAKAMGVSAQRLATAGTVGGSPGSGGGYGGGQGKGVGGLYGPGKGTDPEGKLLTKSQRRERRWLINFSGSGVEHLKKLKALKVTLALPSRDPQFFRLVVLSGPRPRFKIDDLRKYRAQVKWFNQHPPSLQRLARVLAIRTVPRYVVIFLPAEVEEEMAKLEVNYKGVPEDRIKFTWFEIRRLDDGSYGPVVVKQEVRG